VRSDREPLEDIVEMCSHLDIVRQVIEEGVPTLEHHVSRILEDL
jgi:hypothetical protein